MTAVCKKWGETDGRYQNISAEELQQFLDSHEAWVETGGTKGEMAVLHSKNLDGVDLGGRNLREAWIAFSRLRGANLSGAKFQGADLRESDLRNSYVASVDFSGANLADVLFYTATGFDEPRKNALDPVKIIECKPPDLRWTQFKDAVLTHVDLSMAKNLLPESLAGADISGSKLPEDIHDFKGPLEHVKDACINARNTFYALLLLCAYSGLAILQTGEKDFTLPLINLGMPITDFLYVVPILLTSIYVYHLLKLQHLWAVVADLPAIFPNGKRLHKTVYPWLLIGLVRAHFPLLRKGRPVYSYIQNFLSIIITWVPVPFTIGFLIYKNYESPEFGPVLRYIYLGSLAVAIFASVTSYGTAVMTLRRKKPFLDRAKDWVWKTKDKIYWWLTKKLGMRQ